MAKKYDFAGWATKNDVRCADGRIIRKNAFADQDGARVPLFWNHQHNDPEMVLGHAILMNREDGVYAEGYFNNSAKAQHVKDSIAHGDLLALSIYANQLKQDGSNVLHGVIRELSVVPGGANPEALIETAMLAHGDLWDDEVMVFQAEEENILSHAAPDDEEEEKEEKKETEVAEEESEEEAPADEKDKKKKKPTPEVKEVEASEAEKDGEEEDSKEPKEEEDEEKMKHSATDEKTVGDVLKTLNEDQKKAVAVLIDAISNDEDEDEDEEEEADEADEEEEAEVKHNVFDNERNYGPVLSHSDMETIFADWKRVGSLKEAVRHQMEEGGVLAHTVYNHDDEGNQTTAQTYGAADIRYLFPDAQAIDNEPDYITRPMDWVKKVMNGVRHTPFSRVKSLHANLTMDEARAKGYIKGAKKADEVFALLRRVTTPQTIYKKQKLDRDDILDITDFNVVAWIKREMRLMLEEECARAMLVGDGRSSASADKISEDHVRPMASDAALYTVKVVLPDAEDSVFAKNMIKAAIQARKNYKGSGNLAMFTTANWHTEMVLLEDQMGRPLYDTDDKLATKLRVSDGIWDVEPMEGVVDSDDNELVAVLVDLKDYNVGADKGGQTEFFEDFDIDYNQEKYLLETRFSGALVKPYSAIAIYKASSSTDTN